MAKSRTLGDDIPLAFRPYIRSILSGNAIKPPEAPEADWNALLERLRNHRIIPLLSYLISSLPEALRPPRNIRRTMHKAFAASHLRDMHMDRQLQPIVAAFAERGIELIVLKGPALAHSVYPHPATRPYADLDLLVKWSQMDDAHAALLDLGYVSEGRRFASPLRNVIGQDEYRPGGQLQASRTVELHWGLSAFPREQPDLFARSVQLEVRIKDDQRNFASICFRTLHPVDAFIFNAVNSLVSHPTSRLLWTCDAAFVGAQLKTREDWNSLQRRIFDRTEYRAVRASLNLAHEWFGMTPPEGHDDLEKWPAPPEAGLGAATGRGSNWITGLNQLSRDGDGNGKRHLRFWLWLIFPPAPYVRSTYPPKYPILLPFSYLRRWLSWAREVIFTTKST